MYFYKINTKSSANGIFLLFVVFVLYNVKADDVSVVNSALPPTCYTCEGANCLRVTKLNTTTDCTDPLDYCVTIFKGFTVVARGCYAELTPSLRQRCDSDSHPECTKCIGNRCNNKGRADFKCIECNSSYNNKCLTDVIILPGVECPIPTAPNSYCYVRQNTDGTTERGCLVHQREQRECLSNAQCSMCVSDFTEACNTYKITTRITSGVDSLLRNYNVNTIIKISLMFITVLRYD
ncbi:uncharacterized protein [Eurosta solidaginis]|uniref:uncharacterized protein n=1 Tax=Eurosta solidaginis TaxID=178769 RepID=UPI0035307FFA